MSTTPRLIPDTECVQGKCGCTTTGCWDVCTMKHVPVVIATGPGITVSAGIVTTAVPDARIADLETALRAAQATIGGLEMEVARLTVALQAEHGAALEEAAVIAENIRFAFPASPTERAFNTGIESAVRCIRAAILATKTGSPA